MAEKKQEARHVSICCVENGYKVECQYEEEKTLGQRAGWVPCSTGECKTYVEKTKEAVIKRLEEIL
jgi:hypothetical protein